MFDTLITLALRQRVFIILSALLVLGYGIYAVNQISIEAFPDVQAQDRLLGLNDGRGEVRFFHNGRQTAQLRDAEYARLFFGIWLSPRTSEPQLRQALLALPAP